MSTHLQQFSVRFPALSFARWWWATACLLCYVFSGQLHAASTQITEVYGRGAQLASVKESRVIFDEDIYWATSKHATDEILARIKLAGFNVYVPCVWHGRGTRYRSQVAPIDPALQARIDAGDDPLAYLLQQAHELGIQVHPWFTVVRREGGLFPQWRAEGTTESAFDVHDPGFRAFAVDLMMDVVRRYPVDGINLDYIRSMGICRSDSCKADYAARFGRGLEQDIRLRRLPLNSSTSAIAQWNAEAVGAIVSEFSKTAKTVKPGLLVSIDAHPLHPDLILQGQDAIDWTNRGWIDVIFAMDYAEKPDVTRMQQVRAALRKPKKVILLTSLFDRVGKTVVPRRADTIAGYIALTRRLWPGSGIAFYHFKQLTDLQIEELRTGPFSHSVVPEWAASHQ